MTISLSNPISRRKSGSLAFDQPWAAYEAGFGQPSEDHWLGLAAISALSACYPSELVVELGSCRGRDAKEEYPLFMVSWIWLADREGDKDRAQVNLAGRDCSMTSVRD